MVLKEHLAHLNPNAHEFVPLQVKAGACQKSVDYLCKMTGLETLLSLVERQDHKRFAGASLNAPMHHHYSGLIRNSLERELSASITDTGLPQLTKHGSGQLLEESEEDSEMFENRVRAKISGVRSQVCGVQKYSHAMLYISDCGTPMRTAKLTSYEHFNEGLVQIFGSHIPAVLSHVHHEFFYHIVSDKLLYRVQLTFSFDDGPNVVKFDSRYGFTDALLNVYEKFSYMLESWGYSLVAGNAHPVRPESWFATKAPVLELVGRERLIYSKSELLSIAAIQSMQGGFDNIVSEDTIMSFPDRLRIEHVSFISRNLGVTPFKRGEHSRIGYTWHRRHFHRHNQNRHNNREEVIVVKKPLYKDHKESSSSKSEDVIEVKRTRSFQPSSSSQISHVNKEKLKPSKSLDIDSQVVVVEKENKEQVVEKKKSRRRNRRKANKQQQKAIDEDTSSASSSGHSEKEESKGEKKGKPDMNNDNRPEAASNTQKNQKKHGCRSKGKKEGEKEVEKSSEDGASSQSTSGDEKKEANDKEEVTKTDILKPKRQRRRHNRRNAKKATASGEALELVEKENEPVKDTH